MLHLAISNKNEKRYSLATWSCSIWNRLVAAENIPELIFKKQGQTELYSTGICFQKKLNKGILKK